jgi:hypothetical protein
VEQLLRLIRPAFEQLLPHCMKRHCKKELATKKIFLPVLSGPVFDQYP